MIVKHFKLSQPEKDRLIRIKAKTGIQNWNVLCRWALCWSLAEPSIPGGVDPLSDSNVEMDWSTFAGEYSEIYEAIIRQRCVNDSLGDDRKNSRKTFQAAFKQGYQSLQHKRCSEKLFRSSQIRSPEGGSIMAIYLDYNASAPIDERVLERMVDVYRSHYGNADSRTHIFGTDAKEIVASARKTLRRS